MGSNTISVQIEIAKDLPLHKLAKFKLTINGSKKLAYFAPWVGHY